MLACVFILAFCIVFPQLFQSAATLSFSISLDFLHPPPIEILLKTKVLKSLPVFVCLASFAVDL